MKSLIEEAETSRGKEAYQLLENTPSVRIGVGARSNLPNPPSFFVEVVVKLSPQSNKVNLKKLQKNLHLLQSLQSEGFILTYQEDVSISCEAIRSINEINRVCTSALALVKNMSPLKNHCHLENITSKKGKITIHHHE